MNLPNKITVFRIVMIPVFIICMSVNFTGHEIAALIVYIVAAASDFVDGHIARSQNLITDFGKFMDPLADKLLTSAAFICLVELKMIPAWVVITIIAREFAITGLRTLAANNGTVIAASMWGKAKTMSQMIATVLLLVSLIPQMQAYPIIGLLGNIGIYIALILTIISGVDYFRLNKDVFQSM